MRDNSQTKEHYDQLANHWDAFTESKSKREVLWPTIQSLLPDLASLRVLDAGCGNGGYSAWLADQGAEVVGVDFSQEMIRVAKETYGDQAAFRQADLTDSLDFIEDDYFDLVLCQHVFSHLPKLDSVLKEFSRILKPGGELVVSTHNPVHDFLVVWEQEYPDTSVIDGIDVTPVVSTAPEAPNYRETESFEISWSGPNSSNPGRYYRRSVSGLLQPLLEAGFQLGDLVEPDFKDIPSNDIPDLPEELRRRPPRSICFRAKI